MEQANHNHLPDNPSAESRPYSHTHTETKAVLNRLSRAAGSMPITFWAKAKPI